MFKKKSLWICASAFPKQSETFVSNHVKGMIDRGFEVFIVADRSDGEAWKNLLGYEESLRGHVFLTGAPANKFVRLMALLKTLLISLFKVDMQLLKAVLHAKKSLNFKHLAGFIFFYQALRDKKIELMHCHFGVLGAINAVLKELGIVEKLVVTFHGFDVAKYVLKDRTNDVYRLLYSEANLLLPISRNWERALIGNGAPAEKIRVHHVGIRPDVFDFSDREIGSPLKILTTARLVEKKGITYAIDAMSELRNKGIQFEYHIVGDGPKKTDIEKKVELLGLQSQVRFYGSRSNQFVKKLLSESDIFLLPSVVAEDGDQEGIPVVLMEAMASGVIAISSVHSGIPELIENKVSGFLVPEKDHKGIAEVITSISVGEVALSRIRQEARRKVERDFDDQRLNDSLLSMYSSI